MSRTLVRILIGAAVATATIGLSPGLAFPARADEGVTNVDYERQDRRTVELDSTIAGAAGASAEPRAPEAQQDHKGKSKKKKKPKPEPQLTCPVAAPRRYSDTYGAPRPGGRKHMGTDIFAPRGAAIFAIEDGTIARLGDTPLGGISLSLKGDSDTRYYYAHIDGYVDGLEEGADVKGGEQLAYNGDTGNARGTRPHLHLEVMPDGGDNVNPYPYVQRACG
jgi:murein DD-endopeptidase MepM/ murein hydrolase activator NlpD